MSYFGALYLDYRSIALLPYYPSVNVKGKSYQNEPNVWNAIDATSRKPYFR